MKIGILGGGQLARMLTLAAVPLGHQTLCIDPNPNSGAKALTTVLCADFTCQATLDKFVAEVDVITIETENIPTTTLKFLQQHKPVYPSLLALQTCQDRLLEKQFCQSLNLPTANFWTIESLDDLQSACSESGFPALLKTRRLGYDGKGQLIIRSSADIEPIWNQSQQHDLILEQWIHFDREVSCIGVRGIDGDMEIYPITENHHIDGILHTSTAPAKNITTIQTIAHHYLSTMMAAFNYVGALAIELFQVGDQLVINEMAPRVHNSGHWSIEGAACSQFENHIRAITAMPLGQCAPIGYSVMINAISELPDCNLVLKIPFSHWHDYGKTPRANRKLGHATIHCNDANILETSLTELTTLKPFNRGEKKHD